ncbi:hypothetical protein BJY01DRAFT_163402 [Aspergillus pseudoustus]|uniref:Xylanolytic transcriptional activator regulatory domain-containing protein n=1 Tax=Aspergillus pseudoustus TaxID=1810923 RepID=A0ABR4IB55_9EURO
MAHLVVELHQQVNSQEARIAELERQMRQAHAHAPAKTPLDNIIATPSHSQDFAIDDIDIGPPIATLRSLGALAKEDLHSGYDPVASGIITLEEAQNAINLYFDHCHPWAPFLREDLRHTWPALRQTAPSLFLAICSVGIRFSHPPKAHSTLTALLDQAISRLLLRPTLSDVTLDSVSVLLLYAQWMPCTTQGNQPPKSRYNEISAWAVLGLAVRYALFLGLDHAALRPFAQYPAMEPSAEEVSRLRVWYNLLTCDFNLMLTSGLPASLDPAPSAQVAKRFGTHPLAQKPADLRVAGLVELVSLVQRVMRRGSDASSRRRLDADGLQRLNNSLDEWERAWGVRLVHSESQHGQLPFTSVRWYRLALNSTALTPFLASRPAVAAILVHSIEASLTAAAQILISLSCAGEHYTAQLQSSDQSSFPRGQFQADPEAVGRLRYAVDSTWISHTFAVTYLVFCYTKGAVDENLQIICKEKHASPLYPPSSDSIISRLLLLARDIFDTVCMPKTNHPAADFRTIVHNATALILTPIVQDEVLAVDEAALQSLLDLMNEAGLEWPGTLFDPGEFWNVDIDAA